VRWLWTKKTLPDVSPVPLDELRKRARILVVDDDETSFPLELIRNEGYCIDYWPKVKGLKELEEGFYDIVILDIGGVAGEFTKEDGLGIIEHIKKQNPSQIVVAFSGQSFDLSKNRFWEMADDSLCKPVDATMCKRLIDHLILTKISPRHYWEPMERLLRDEGFPEKTISKIEDDLARAVKRGYKGNATDIFHGALRKIELPLQVLSTAAKIVAMFCG